VLAGVHVFAPDEQSNVQHAADPYREKRSPALKFQHDQPPAVCLPAQALCRNVEIRLVREIIRPSPPRLFELRKLPRGR
jgi:hypothetical protein